MPESIANKITQHTDHCIKDTTKPPTIGVEWAKFGDFQERRTNTRRDPLVIYLSNVEPKCSIEILNLSAKPDGVWKKDAKKVPFNLDRCLPDGKFGIIFGNKDAQKFGIKPGDVFEIRQVDQAGNASDPVRVTLSQKGAGSWSRVSLDGRARDKIGFDLAPGQYNYAPYQDGRAPVVVTENLKIDAAAKGKATLSSKKAVEPGCTISVTNERTRKAFSAVADKDGALCLKFDAAAGDPIHIRATDHNGKVTDLGITSYAPKCCKGGQLAKAQLDQA